MEERRHAPGHDALRGSELWTFTTQDLPSPTPTGTPGGATPTATPAATPAQPLQPGQTATIRGTISAGEVRTSNLTLASPGDVELRFRLTGAEQAGCTVELTVIRPAGSRLGPYTLSSQGQVLTQVGPAGVWSFRFSATGACAGAAYEVSASLQAPSASADAAPWILLLLAAAVLAGRRRRLASTR